MNFQFAHAGAEGMRIDAQQPRGPEGTFDTSVCGGQRRFDVAANDDVEGLDARGE